MITFKVAQTKSEMTAIYKLRYDVYCLEKNFLDPNDYPGRMEHDIWDKHAVHFIAKCGSDIAGTVRLIKDSPQGFPIEKHFDIQRPEGHAKVFAEGSRYIVNQDYRHSIYQTANGLNRCIINYCKNNDITDLFIVLDERLYTAYTRIGLLLKKLGEPVYCYGCINAPYVMPLKETLINLKTNKPKMYEFFSRPYTENISCSRSIKPEHSLYSK